jgi:hypothetical protein
MATASNIQEFQEQAAREIYEIERERGATGSSAAVRLASAAINAKVTPAAGEGPYKIEVTVADNAGLPHGTKRSDFKSSALEELDARHLSAEKERVWQWFRRQAGVGYFDDEQAAGALTRLGYTALPSVRTQVSLTLPGERVNRYGERQNDVVSFTLDGDVSREDIEARVAGFLKPTGALALAREAFPEALDLPAAPEHQLELYASWSWPKHSEHYAS